MALKTFTAQIDHRDSLQVDVEVSQDETKGVLKAVRAMGCHMHLQKVQELRANVGKPLHEISAPIGSHHTDLLVREVLAKAQGQFALPYKEEELCHCRAIPTHVVDQSILSGCHTPEQVSRATSASTACGSCRHDVVKLLQYRLNK
ncbi:MAG: bacterioferritin-associated ferredoxin [Bdellovibrionales bacterium]